MAETTNTVPAEEAETTMNEAVRAAGAETTDDNVPAAPAPDNTDQVLADKRQQWLSEWNQSKDRELAKVHQQYQNRERTIRQQARERLEEVGDTDAEGWENYQHLTDKAAAYDSMQQQASAWQAWNDHVGQVASAYGLKGEDPRLANAESADDLVTKAKSAMAQDAKEERAKAKEEATTTKRERLEQRAASGDLDSLSGLPAGATGDLRQQYDRAKSQVRRGNTIGHTELRQKFRKLGLDI